MLGKKVPWLQAALGAVKGVPLGDDMQQVVPAASPAAATAPKTTPTSAAAAAAAAGRELPPVDVVYSYVQGADPVFRRKYAAVIGKPMSCHRKLASSEIYISLVALFRFAPWVNRVFVAVDNQTFPLEFLEPAFRNKVSFVDLMDFVPSEYLPTFNSHVIEALLHRIPGLANHFLYFNDDMLLTRPLPKQALFNSNGTFAAQIRRPHAEYLRWLRSGDIPEAKPWLHPRYNAAKLFQAAFPGSEPPGQDLHGISSLTIEAANATWMLFGPTILKTMPHKLCHYAPLEDQGDVHFMLLAQRVGVELGLLQMERHLRVHLFTSAARLKDIVPGMFIKPSVDVLCLQALWMLPGCNLESLCWMARQAWCSSWDSPHCDAFQVMCMAVPSCKDLEAT